MFRTIYNDVSISLKFNGVKLNLNFTKWSKHRKPQLYLRDTCSEQIELMSETYAKRMHKQK